MSNDDSLTPRLVGVERRSSTDMCDVCSWCVVKAGSEGASWTHTRIGKACSPEEPDAVRRPSTWH